MTTINSIPALPPLPTLDFTWSPIGVPVTFNFAGNSYPPAGTRFAAFYTPINQLITFTADATPAPGTSIVQYRWDLGDGVTQYGAVTGHTYTVPNPSLTAKLEITDNLNRKAYVSKVLLLQVMFPTVVQDHLRV